MSELEETRNVRMKRFPYKEALRQWWNAPSAEKAEFDVLSMLPFFPKPDATRTATSKLVDIGKNRYINEFHIQNTTNGTPHRNLVMLHGYGTGLGIFFQNYDQISSTPDWNVFSLDLLGLGRSSRRPKFKIQTSDTDKKIVNEKTGEVVYPAVIESENYFIDAIEDWRQVRKIEKFTLMGHSMGGYLAAAYAFKYPERVEKLILVSPVGVERSGDVEVDDSASLLQGAKEIAAQPVPDERLFPAITHDEGMKVHPGAIPPQEKIHWLMKYLWTHHYSPFMLIRQAPPGVGVRLMSAWSLWRFQDLSEEDRMKLHLYSYKLMDSKASGELALTRLLKPVALARMPLLDRLDKIKCPTMWMYGEKDWMNAEAGAEATQTLNRNASNENNTQSVFKLVKRAGHHIYLDNTRAFNSLIVDFMTR
ncbi:Alpha/Beta hydrolase protein [Yarrowia lipolytica]|jgi:cardiolipin-specific phospholipase|uniref:YALI0E34881p n=2 Tax=Yarrowia lipolytica TaxID=4952 RepID=Q6C3H1_YARLI|nr:YALI0E34881p [Yarrowia lipolytica CLIB122]AOW06407.1 hypothetical protein YALI1_E41421g [Yarrowia lipolytica]KAB8282610.1 Alpha/Beta hydrolase protein [Yarrowia lipolytica]KAE8172038.1 Alpha/Beta hydrolase protein [Yarrowia lipolytica]KAJ8057775.1 Alpha/Beta hydrolase protein [Yarrowia lipolytica]QNQ00945.1 Putative cardiolipin-specific deacylase [Yarrowia lipolytica]|eukprot:XP_504791.1 YALI0E34881p [Yarrowia lipolytica CLIB122]